ASTTLWATRAPPVKSGPSWPAGTAATSRRPSTASSSRPSSVLALDHEERSTDRAGQLRLLPRKFEPRRELGRDFHPVGELESDGALLVVIDGVHHVDRQAALVEHVGDADVLDLKLRRLERARLNDEVALL